MGWTTTYRKPGQTDREWFQENVFGTGPNAHRIVACATRGFVFYVAARMPDSAGEDAGLVYGAVVPMQRHGSRQNFGYKTMDETMGPRFYGAPAKVLDALSPTTHEHALEWRRRCRAELERVASIKAARQGDTLVLMPGSQPPSLTVVDPKRRRGRGPNGGFWTYRVSDVARVETEATP